MEKKKSNGVIIIILFIIILGMAGYLVYDKVLSKDLSKDKKEVVDEKDSKKDKNNSLVGTYNRGTCAETGEVDCATLVITGQTDDALYFELSALRGIVENGPNIGELINVAFLDGDNTYKFYSDDVELDTESTILFTFNDGEVKVEETYSNGINPYAGHNVFFAGTYQKNTTEDGYENIARSHIRTFMSLLNQESGAYTYCGEIIGNNSEDFSLVTSTTYNSVEELKKHLKTIISDKLFDKYFKADSDQYIEKDGKLYCHRYGMDGYGVRFSSPSSLYLFKDFNISVSDIKDDSFKATISYDYQSEVDFNAKFTYTFDFVKNGNNWLINKYTEKKEEY